MSWYDTSYLEAVVRLYHAITELKNI